MAERLHMEVVRASTKYKSFIMNCSLNHKSEDASHRFSSMSSEDDIVILKSVMPSLPDGYEETRLGDPRGSIRQFRRERVHVREYEDRFVVHEDHYDPRSDPIQHLVHDSPETLFALGSAIFLSKASCPRSEEHTNRTLSLNPLAFLLAFFSLNTVFRRFKHLLIGS